MKRIYLTILSILVLVGCPLNVSAMSEDKLDEFAQNDIMFYDPDGGGCISFNNSAESSNVSSSSGAYGRLKDTVRQYYARAMEAQTQYGTPWEMVFAQMQKESSTGTAGIAVAGATNNWLGITGSGDAGYWESSSGRKWAKYSSVGASIADWAGTRVLRNGYYDAAYRHLSLSNYDLSSFVLEVLRVYAPSSDGNDPVGYHQDVMNLINGPIREVKEELNLPSSEEYARQNNIDASQMVSSPASENIDTTRVNYCNGSLTNGQLIFYNQGEEPWGSMPYGNCGGDTIKAAGCGPSSMAMVITALTGNKVTPDIVAKEAAEKGYRACGNGSYATIANLASRYGLKVTTGPWEESFISEALRQGKMIHVAGTGHSPFTSRGHYIAIRGITDSGKWLVFDSWHNHENDHKEFDPSYIITERHRSGNIYVISK